MARSVRWLKSIMPLTPALLPRNVITIPRITAVNAIGGANAGFTNEAASTIAASTNKVIAIRFMTVRFHTSILWLRSSIAYCIPMLISMRPHAMWYCA